MSGSTTRVKLIFSVVYDRKHQKRFRLEQPCWPQTVLSTVRDLEKDLSRRGRPPDTDAFEVLATDDVPLAIGQPVRLTVSYGRHATLSQDVTLGGIVSRFVVGQ